MARTVQDAIDALDADILAAEVRLATLRAKRRDVESAIQAALGDYLTVPLVLSATTPTVTGTTTKAVSGDGPSVVVADILDARNLIDFTIDGLSQFVAAEGHDLTREQINNGVAYLARKKIVVKRPGRGNWRRVVADSAAPVEDADYFVPVSPSAYAPTDRTDTDESVSVPLPSSPFAPEAATG